MVLKDIDYLYFYCVIDNFLFGELDNIKDGKIGNLIIFIVFGREYV